jgi:threonine/homoserine/homoserine lactone efflux protein
VQTVTLIVFCAAVLPLIFTAGPDIIYISKSHIELKTDKRLLGNRRMFLAGVATSVMNPKAILFFFSYLPQFAVPEAGNLTGQLFVLGTLFTVMCGLVYGMYGFFSGAIGERLLKAPPVTDLIRWLTGSVLIGLGLALALLDKR